MLQPSDHPGGSFHWTCSPILNQQGSHWNLVCWRSGTNQGAVPVRSSSSPQVGWIPLSGMEALQGSCSDQLLLDSPWGTFNDCHEIYCFEDTWYYIALCFDLVETYCNVLKSQHKHDTALEIYIWITMQKWFPLLIYTCPLPGWRASPVHQEGICGLKPSQAYGSLESSFCCFFGFTLFVRLSCVIYDLLPVLAWLAGGHLTC